MGVPKSYRSMEEFERETIRPDMKCGFSLDDLMQDTTFEGSDFSSTTPSTSTPSPRTTTTTDNRQSLSGLLVPSRGRTEVEKHAVPPSEDASPPGVFSFWRPSRRVRRARG